MKAFSSTRSRREIADIAKAAIRGMRIATLGKIHGLSSPRVLGIINTAIQKSCPIVYRKHSRNSWYDGQPNPPGLLFYRRYRRFFTARLNEWAENDKPDTPPTNEDR